MPEYTITIKTGNEGASSASGRLQQAKQLGPSLNATRAASRGSGDGQTGSGDGQTGSGDGQTGSRSRPITVIGPIVIGS